MFPSRAPFFDPVGEPPVAGTPCSAFGTPPPRLTTRRSARELPEPGAREPGRPRAPPRPRPAGQRRAALDPRRRASVPAGRAGQDHADRLPRRLSAGEARGAGPGAPEGPRTATSDLGRGDARPGRDERPRQRAALLRD